MIAKNWTENARKRSITIAKKILKDNKFRERRSGRKGEKGWNCSNNGVGSKWGRRANISPNLTVGAMFKRWDAPLTLVSHVAMWFMPHRIPCQKIFKKLFFTRLKNSNDKKINRNVHITNLNKYKGPSYHFTLIEQIEWNKSN